jgi:hypothetical protein
MKKTLYFISLAFLMSVGIYAQKASGDGVSSGRDLNGTWILDGKKSILPIPGERESYTDFSLVIGQNGPEIKITKIYLLKGQESKSTITLFGDERGEQNAEMILQVGGAREASENVFWLEEANIKSETVWKKGKLIRSGTFGIEVGILKPKRDLRHVIKEVFDLSDDGKTLIVWMDLKILDSPNNIVSKARKFVFQRVVS